jgi:hypothetical protein
VRFAPAQDDNLIFNSSSNQKASTSPFRKTGDKSKFRPVDSQRFNQVTSNDLKNPVDLTYHKVLKHILKFAQDTFPTAETQILLVPTTAEAKDFVLRTLSNTIREALRLLSRKDSMDLWQKLQPLFQLKFEINEANKQAEPLGVGDINEQLFKIDTYF